MRRNNRIFHARDLRTPPRLIFMLTTEALEETDGDGDVVVMFKF